MYFINLYKVSDIHGTYVKPTFYGSHPSSLFTPSPLLVPGSEFYFTLGLNQVTVIPVYSLVPS